MSRLFRIEFRYSRTDEWLTDCTFETFEEAIEHLKLLEKVFRGNVEHRLVIGFPGQ